MDDMSLQIVIEAQNEATAAFESLVEAIKAVQQAAESMTSAFNSVTDVVNSSMESAGEAVRSLTEPVEAEAEEISNAFAESSRQAEEDLSRIGEGLNNVAPEAEREAEEVGNAFSAPSRQAEEDLSRIGEGLQSIAPAAEEESSQVTNAFADSARQAEEDLSRIGEGMRTVAPRAEEDATAMATSYATGATAAEESINGLGKNIDLFSNRTSMDMMFAGMTLAAIAAPIDAAVKKSVESFGEFDQSMRLVNEEAKLSEGGFKNLESSIIDLSNQTGISANDLAKGLYNVVATGLTDTTKAMEELKVAAEGAKAGNTDLDTSTRALNAVMGAYGLSADQATHIMDVMFTAVNNGQMHFDDLARSVGQSATAAATAGVSYEELAAAQATLTNVGKSAEMASMNLNSLIIGMIAPTAEATKEAKKLGIEWDAAALKQKGLTGMVNEAIGATKGNNEELKKLLPNQRAYIAALALGKNAHEQYTHTLQQMQKAHGATAAALKESEKGFGDALEKFKTSIGNLGITLGGQLAPMISKAASFIEKLAAGFQKMSPATQKVIAVTAALVGILATIGSMAFMAAAGFGQLMLGFRAATSVIGGIVGSAGKLVGGFTSLIKIVTSLGGVFRSACSIALTAFRSLVMAVVANPMILVWVAIGAAIVALAVLIYTHWNQIKAFLVNTWDTIKSVATTAWNAVKTVIETVWNGIKAVIMSVVGAIKALIEADWNAIQAITSAVWNTIKEVLKTVWDVIKTIFFTTVLVIYDMLTGKWSDIGDVFQHASEKLQEITHNMWNAIKSIWSGLVQHLISLATSLWSNIKNRFEAGVHAVIDFVTNLWSDIEDGFSEGVDAVVNFVTDLWNKIVSSFNDGINAVINFVTDLWNNIESAFTNGISNAINAVSDMINEIRNFFVNLPGEALQWGENLIHGFVQGIKNMIGEVASAASSVVQEAKNFLGFHSPAKEGPGADADTWAPNLVNMFAGGLSDGADKVRKAALEMIAPVKQTMPTLDFGLSASYNVVHSVATAGAGNSRSPVINVYVQGNVARNEKELGQIVAREIWQQAKMQGKF
jgi:TP901 family phage tail tape measure protein